jgi:DNA-binding NarL/FixJ family response regulator
MIKILLADDHFLIREGLKQIFALVDDIAVVAEASSGNELLTVLDRQEVDVLLLDMNMPSSSGVNLIARIRTISDELPILVLTMHNEPEFVKRILNSGVQGYVTKDSDPEILLAGVRALSKGYKYIDPALRGE